MGFNSGFKGLKAGN